MARRKRREQKERLASRKEILRHRKDAEDRQRLLTVFVPVLVVVILILGWGAYRELFQKPRTPVATVNGEQITAKTFQPRIQYERYQSINSLQQFSQYAQVSSDSGNFLQQFAQQTRDGVPDRTMDQLIDEALIRQEAKRRGIEVTDEDVTTRIYTELTTTATPVPTAVASPITTTSGITVTNGITSTGALTETATVTPTLTQGEVAVGTREAARKYDQFVVQGVLSLTGLTESQYRDIVRQQIYREKVQEALASEVATTAKQVDAEFLLFPSEPTAKEAKQALDDGASWDSVVAQYLQPTPAVTGAATGAITATGVTTTTGAITATVPITSTGSIATEPPPATDTPVPTDTPEPTDTATPTEEVQSSTGISNSTANTTTAPITATGFNALTTTDGLSETAGAGLSAAAAQDNLTTTTGISGTVSGPTPAPTATPNPYATQHGERKWYTREGLKNDLGLSDSEATAILDLEKGSASDTVDGRGGYYLVQVFDTAESREVDPSELETRKSSALDDWLTSERTKADIQRYATADLVPPEPDWFIQEFQQIAGSVAPTIEPGLLVSPVVVTAEATP